MTPIDVFAEGDGGTPSSSRGERAALHRTHGEVHVVSRVVGFKKIKFYTNENVGSGELDLPEQQMHTTSYWLTIPAPVMAMLPYASDDRRDGVVGLAFALKQVAQLLLMSDAHDIGISIDTGDQEPGGAGANPQKIFVYDNYPGGIGFSAPLYRMHHELLTNTRKLIDECQCEHGCPSCVGSRGRVRSAYEGGRGVASARLRDISAARRGRGVAHTCPTLETIQRSSAVIRGPRSRVASRSWASPICGRCELRMSRAAFFRGDVCGGPHAICLRRSSVASHLGRAAAARMPTRGVDAR